MTEEQDTRLPNADGPIEVSSEERHRMIAVAAYYLAERRGFSPGGELGDWWQAVDAIDRMLARMRRTGVTRAEYERTGLRNALRIWVEPNQERP
jgi:hypothetical protein